MLVMNILNKKYSYINYGLITPCFIGYNLISVFRSNKFKNPTNNLAGKEK